ncbi:hypothetical protein ABT297_38155 [Dactylosporangium sp. NPDC000555]|uniref:hypothetical protein n=1 Tax=Dactylosporangium sp. NPDC000555 TaxID=3154260 RepID=UPI00332B1964
MWRSILAGAAAGAAGTTALNAVGYADMAWRGRPASSAPDRVVERIAERIDQSVPGEGETRGNRVSGLSGLSGTLTGVGIGAAAGLLRACGVHIPPAAGAAVFGAAAMAATDGSMAALRVSDPRTWSAKDWVSDAVPHLAYGAVTATVLDALTRPRTRRLSR